MAVLPLTGKALRSYHAATAATNIWEGAVRSGKTVVSLLKWIEYCQSAPEGALAIIGKTERTVKRNVVDPLLGMLGKRARYVAGTGEFWLLDRLCYVMGANDAKAQEKVQGLTLAGVYGDELSNWPAGMYNMTTTRLSVPGAKFFGTCNPAGPSHWLKRDVLDRAACWLAADGSVTSSGDLDVARFSFTLDDNPHLSPQFVDRLKHQYVGLFHRRYILGEWVPAEGAVWSMLDPDRHVVSDLPPIQQWIAMGIDHGTANPLHAVMIGVPAGGHIDKMYVTHEYRWDSRVQRRQMTNAEYSMGLRDWCRKAPTPGTRSMTGIMPRRVVIDPSASDFRVQMHRDGWPGVTPADNEVVPGIGTVATLLGAGALVIHESCVHLLRESLGYSWDDKAAQRGDDKPLKVADHGPDALRYGVHTTRSVWRSALSHKIHVRG